MTVAVADATGVVGMLVLGCGVEGFDVGAAVECNLGGPNGWTPGTDFTWTHVQPVRTAR